MPTKIDCIKLQGKNKKQTMMLHKHATVAKTEPAARAIMFCYIYSPASIYILGTGLCYNKAHIKVRNVG